MYLCTYVVQVVKEQFCTHIEIARADIPVSTWKQLNVDRSGNMHVFGQTQVRMYSVLVVGTVCSVVGTVCSVVGTVCSVVGTVWCVVYSLHMWVMSILFTVKVTLWFQHILLRFCGYACDRTWFTRDLIEWIYRNATLLARIYTSC